MNMDAFHLPRRVKVVKQRQNCWTLRVDPKTLPEANP